MSDRDQAEDAIDSEFIPVAKDENSPLGFDHRDADGVTATLMVVTKIQPTPMGGDVLAEKMPLIFNNGVLMGTGARIVERVKTAGLAKAAP